MYRQIVGERGAPSIVHVHVAMKAGILARWLNRKYNVPYVVTEHWTGYNPQSQPNIYTANWLYKRMNKQVLDGAVLLIPVSDALGKMVNQYFATVPYQVIPNAVNTDVFYHTPFLAKRFRFIHPSYMSYQKNPEGILAACKIVKDKGYDFELLMLGSIDERLQTISKQHNLQSCVLFEPAVLYPVVAKRMQESSSCFYLVVLKICLA
jgi:glycosyltransferase involved in cell wall biosynthesis